MAEPAFGEWFVLPGTHVHQIRAKGDDRHNPLIAETVENHATCNARDNAWLLAAAPDMLKTLRDVQTVLAVSLAWENSAKIKRQIESAIAKATLGGVMLS